MPGFASLLIHDVTVTNDGAQSGTDRYGNPIFGEVSVVEKMRVQPGPRTGNIEDIIDRDTRVTQFRLFCKPDTTANGLSRLTWNGRALRVVGEPRPLYDSGTLHHWEMDAEEVLG